MRRGCGCVRFPLKSVGLGGVDMTDKKERSSILSPFISALLEEKHANGYDCESEELILNRFDTYCTDNGLKTTEITKEFLARWMEKSPTEGDCSRAKRISVVRQLMLFMAAMGIHVYIPHDFCHFGRTVPHIFDPVELNSQSRKTAAATP